MKTGEGVEPNIYVAKAMFGDGTFDIPYVGTDGVEASSHTRRGDTVERWQDGVLKEIQQRGRGKSEWTRLEVEQ